MIHLFSDLLAALSIPHTHELSSRTSHVIRLSHIYPYDASVFWSSSCPQYSTHSWGVFSRTSLFIKYPGHSEALSIFKVTSFSYEKFPTFVSLMISIFLKLHLFVYWNFCVPLCCFPCFLYLSVYSTFWICPQLLSFNSYWDFIYIIFKFKKFCVCVYSRCFVLFWFHSWSIFSLSQD